MMMLNCYLLAGLNVERLFFRIYDKVEDFAVGGGTLTPMALAVLIAYIYIVVVRRS